MARYVDAEALAEQLRLAYCKDCNSRDGVMCRACWLDIAITAIEDYSTADIGEWVSVEDRLPAENGKYIVRSRKGSVYQMKYYTYPAGGHWGQRDKGASITHWRPFPDPPQEEEEGAHNGRKEN